MVLEVGGTVVAQQADEAAITQAIRSLAEQAEDEAFAILSSSDETYIQTVRAGDDAFGLEYQQGSTAQHYGCYQTLGEDQVLQAFLFYQQGDPRWHSDFIWEKMEI